MQIPRIEDLLKRLCYGVVIFTVPFVAFLLACLIQEIHDVKVSIAAQSAKTATISQMRNERFAKQMDDAIVIWTASAGSLDRQLGLQRQELALASREATANTKKEIESARKSTQETNQKIETATQAIQAVADSSFEPQQKIEEKREEVFVTPQVQSLPILVAPPAEAPKPAPIQPEKKKRGFWRRVGGWFGGGSGE